MPNLNPQQQAPQPTRANAAVFLIPPLIIIIVALLVYIATSNPTPTATRATATQQQAKSVPASTLTQPAKNTDLASTKRLAENDLAFSIGPKDAKVTLVEFLDFQCPFCHQTAPTVDQLIKDYNNKSVRFIFRHYPLVSIHPFALITAQGAVCAREQNAFLAMHDKLYAEQDSISAQLPYTAAKELNLDMQKFTSCMSSDASKSALTKDVTDALDLNIEGTPTFFINGQKFAGVIEKDVFKSIIDNELNKK